jgi:hypothetical protein
MISKRVDADWWDMHAEVGLFLMGVGTSLILLALIGLIWWMVPRWTWRDQPAAVTLDHRAAGVGDNELATWTIPVVDCWLSTVRDCHRIHQLEWDQGPQFDTAFVPDRPL